MENPLNAVTAMQVARFGRPALAAGLFALLLTACGGGGGSGGPTAPTNNPPTSNAGADQSANEKATVQLTGQGSDPDGDAVTFSWSQVSGLSGEFAMPTSADTDFEAPFIPVGMQDDIVLRLTVRDANGASASDDITLTVASADYVLFLADKDIDNVLELYKYDTQSMTIAKLNTPLVAGRSAQFDYFVSPDGQSVAYLADQETDNVLELYVAAIDGSGVNKINAPIANASGNVTEVQWSPDSTQIVYTADADIDGITEVFLADRDGGNPHKINGSVGAGVVFLENVKWSPDGRYIAQVVVDPVGRRRIGINTHDTTVGGFDSVRVVTMPATGSILDFEWSPDSSKVAYRADQDTDDVFELYTAQPDVIDTQKLSDAMIVAGGDVHSFTWAPDGTRLAYTADQVIDGVDELYTVLPDGSSNVKLNDAVSSNTFFAAWAPDSSRIAYVSFSSGFSVSELYAANPDGTNNTRLNGDLAMNVGVQDFIWSPDSTRVAYQALQDGATVLEIYTSSADGSNNVKINGPVATGGQTIFTSDSSGFNMWSPDSSLIVYTSSESDPPAIESYVTDADGSNRNQVTRTVVAGGGLSPRSGWSADSSSVAYLSRQDDPSVEELYLASADGVDNTRISGAMVTGGNVFVWSWSPDAVGGASSGD